MKTFHVGIVGFGTVGGGTYDVLTRNAEVIAERANCHIRVKSIATRTPSRASSTGIEVSDDVAAMLRDPEIEIIAEAIGGVEPARSYLLKAFRAGKSVVTANKELIAKCGPEIRAAAEEAGVDFLFEGSVGGGIPLIKPLRESLAGNEVLEFMGILNGTTNYILSKMTQEGLAFESVLAQAQALGYAEADPTSDIDGWDALYKLAIVAGIAFNTPIELGGIYREGISQVSARDIEYAAELGYIIKLIALGRRHPNGCLELRVHPTLLPKLHPLASVNDAFNAVFIKGDAVGDVMFYGRGAGADPTGSAVVGDIIEAAKNRLRGSRSPDHAPQRSARLLSINEVRTRFCVRMQVLDRPGAIARIATVFGDKGVSIESVVQKHSDGTTAEIFWVTHHTPQKSMTDSLQAFAELDMVKDVSSVLRVEGE